MGFTSAVQDPATDESRDRKKGCAKKGIERAVEKARSAEDLAHKGDGCAGEETFTGDLARKGIGIQGRTEGQKG